MSGEAINSEHTIGCHPTTSCTGDGGWSLAAGDRPLTLLIAAVPGQAIAPRLGFVIGNRWGLLTKGISRREEFMELTRDPRLSQCTKQCEGTWQNESGPS